jgi:chemotaxis protein methyltransferase WspC
MAFACRKAAANSPPLSARPHAARFLKLPPLTGSPSDSRLDDLADSQRTPWSRPPTEENPSDTASAVESSADAPSPMPDLSHARRLADEGKLREAAALCHAHLGLDAASAQAWYLLGLVHDATGDPLAVECYRKALYLNPNHYETLLQMALLSEKAGDPAKARTFRQRAARIKPNADAKA